MKTGSRSSWSGKWAFILAAAASAVGLGNMWRFPYLAAKYGGGTFLITYLVLVFTFGVSLLLLETAIGRKTGLSAIGAFRHFGKKFMFIGVLASVVPFIIVPYYCIIGGWVTKYAFAYIAAGPAAMADGGTFFSSFITDGVDSSIFMLIFMAAAFIIVARGVKGGIEKANLILMPALIVMAIAIAIFTLTLPGALDGAAYYLKPDLSKFSPELVIGALGQMFYSLSLAMGIMITYGSYLEKKASLTQSVTRIGCFDLGSGEAVAQNSGPSLMFIILPEVFADMGQVATIVGFVFFLLVFFAALTSAISLTETCVSIIQDGAGFSRRKSLVITVVFIVVAGLIINSGYNVLSFIQPLGEGSSLLDFADFISNSVIMPIVALLTCVFVGWIIKPKTIIDEVRISAPFKAAKAWSVMVKYVAPVLVVVILVTALAQSLGIMKF